MQLLFVVILTSFSVRYGFLLGIISLVFVYVTQRAYLSTQKRLRFRHSQSKEAYDAFVLQTTAGLEHIRAFDQQMQTRRELQVRLHCTLKLDYSIAQVLCRLQLLAELWHCFLAVSVVSLALVFPSQTSRGILALTLLCLADTAYFSFGMMDAMDMMEERLYNASRIRKFCEETPQEEDGQNNCSPQREWPSAGDIDFLRATVTAG